MITQKEIHEIGKEYFGLKRTSRGRLPVDDEGLEVIAKIQKLPLHLRLTKPFKWQCNEVEGKHGKKGNDESNGV